MEESAVTKQDTVTRIWLVTVSLLLLVLIVLATGQFLVSRLREATQPRADWSGGQIHVRAAKDGPWLITHLVVYDGNGRLKAVAQLPTPVTIIDSRGHRFSREEIDSLEWINTQDEREEPPATGDKIGVMFLIPSEGKP